MADDKSKRGRQDRNRVARNQPYEVSYFRQKHGLTLDQARKIIEKYGADRDEANKAAQRVKKRS